MFLGRTSRVDVDRYQSFGRVDDDIAARFQLNDRLIHGVELIFDMITLEQRHRVGIMLHTLGMAWHQQLHKVLRGFITVRTLDKNLVDILVIDIADRAFDEVAVGVNQHRRGTFEGVFADAVPQTRQIIEIAFDFRLCAGKASGADDTTHGRGQRQVRHNRLQPLAVRRAVYFAADTTTMRGVGHEHAIPASQAEIGRQRRAFVSAFFLDDLNQQNLTAMDNVLDFVPAAQVHALGADFVAGLGCAAFAAIITASTSATATVVAVVAVAPIVFGVLV